MDVIEEETTLNEVQPELLENHASRANGTVSREEKDNGEKDNGEYRIRKYFRLFRFATALDWVFILLGAVLAAAHGIAIPLMAFYFGEFIRIFIGQYVTDRFLTPLTMADTQLLMLSPSSTGVLFNPVTNNTNFCSELFPAYNTTVFDATMLLSNGTTSLNCDHFITANTTFIDILNACYNEADCLTNDEFFNRIDIQVIVFVCLAVGSFICGSLQVILFEASSQRQVHKLRQTFFAAILRQEIGWFDSTSTGELASRVIDDTLKIQEGIGENLPLSIQWLSTFVGGLVLGFVTDWKVSLVVIAFTPFIAAAAAAGVKFRAYFTAREQDEYAAAGAVAEEVISAITTVVTFGGESKEIKRYDSRLNNANKLGAKRGVYVGLTGGLGYFVLLVAFAAGCWFSGYAVSVGLVSTYTVFVPLIALPYGAFALGSSIKPLGAFSTAANVSKVIFDIIDKTPKTSTTSKESTCGEMSDSTIEFKDVHFTYPIRPDVQILQGLSMKVEMGKTVALVGSSGSGKSTVMQLLLKFYDISSGQILIGNKDISSLDPAWLRENIGVVSQEPVLFDTTIANNIRLGKVNATMAEVVQAAKDANAHDFISSLPDGYNTVVGEKGSQMSGGQKQRIAIARSLVRNPKIMLLDEATSALDAESESIVQEALERASKDRTTIIIAHRLSTIRNADLIISIKDGQVVEEGSHSQLMAAKGIYSHLVSSQTAASDAGHHISGQTSTRVTRTRLTSRKTIRLTYRGSSIRNKLSRQTSQPLVVDPPRSLMRNPSVLSAHAEETVFTKRMHRDDTPKASFSRILKLNSKERWLVVVGVIGAILSALLWPLFGLLLGFILNALVAVPSEVLFKLHPPAALTVLLAIVSGVGHFIRTLCFSVSGERLTARVRSMTFQTILRQEIGWFDDEDNSTGALTTILAEDAGSIQKATGRQIGVVVQNAVILICSMAIALYFSWVLTLVILGLVPVLILSALAEALAFDHGASKLRVAAESSGEIIVESIANIRTVKAFNGYEIFQRVYQDNLSVIRRNTLVGAFLHGITFGLSSGALFILFAVLIPFGAFQVTRPVDHIASLPFQDVFKVAFALGMASVVVGKATRFVPIYFAAKRAAGRVFAVLDRKSLIDSMDKSGIQLDETIGNVVADSLAFSYPTRPDDRILNGLSFSVQSGKTLALVGASGSGKSTVMSLLLRFYDFLGELTLDGTELKDFNIQWLRSQIGLVSQEPTLFDASIAENIRYGALFREVSDDEVVEAAKQANIHSFIQTLPEGYSTNVGASGAQLSGGQKQRIAIARALIRNPKILLLDEATSALDTESERVVQEALDRAQEGRTSIVIAHRLSTIYGADCIAVIKNGRVIELGRHTALMKRRGVYYKLNRYQTVSSTL